MTSPHSMQYAPPRDPLVFERLCRILLSRVMDGEFQRRGRNGQRQDGVDLSAKTSDRRFIAAQCKNKDQEFGKKITPKDIDALLEEVNGFPQKIDEFIILTTARDDKVIQDYVSQINSINGNHNCKVVVWGWDTICDHISSYSEIQRSFYSHFYQKTTFWQKIFLISIFFTLIIVGIIGLTQYFDYRKSTSIHTKQSIAALENLVTLTDGLELAYSNCYKALEEEKRFTFSADLDISCVDPIGEKINSLNRYLKNSSIYLDANAKDELEWLLLLINEDYRQLLITLDITRNFEKNIIRKWVDSCHFPNDKTIWEDAATEVYPLGKLAITKQLEYYFLLRDYISPSIFSIKSRIQIQARLLAANQIPNSMIVSANELNRLISARKSLPLFDPAEPFSMVRGKTFTLLTTRFYNNTGDDFIEQALWKNVYLLAQLKSFQNNPKDVDRLIECGIFNPESRNEILNGINIK